jgi:hypothetical protein
MSLPWLSDPRRPLTSPREIPKLEAWFDALDTASMLTGAGAAVADGEAVALWKDKSGNSSVNALVLNGVDGNYCSLADSAAFTPAGDFAGYAEIRPNDATPTAQGRIFTHNSLAGNRAMSFALNTNGSIEFFLSYDGTNLLNFTTTATSVFADFEKKYIGFQVDVDNGAGGTDCQFFTSPDAVTWTAVEAAKTLAGTGTLFNCSAIFTVGANSAGQAVFNGNIHKIAWLNGTLAGGTPMLAIDFAAPTTKLTNGDTFVCTTGQTVTLNSSGATGARIAGERDLYQGTLANRPVLLQYAGTKYGYLNGTAGNYFSTPDSATVSVTGDIDIRANVVLASYPPAASCCISGKWLDPDQKSWFFTVDSLGRLSFATSANGSATALNYVSTATITSAMTWLRVTLDVDNGSSQNVTTFYYSSDGASWTPLETGKTVAGVTSLFDSTATLLSGARGTGSTENTSGRIYRAQIYDGIAGTLVADFNPALYTSGTTCPDGSDPSVVWTVNGGAHIVTRTGLYGNGSATAMQSAKYSAAQPLSTYVFGEQVSWTSGDYIIDGSAANAAAIVQTTSAPQINLNAGSSANANTGFAVKTFGMLRAVFNGASSLLGVNRVAPATGDAGATAANGLTVFASGGLANNGNAFIAGVVQYGAAQDAATSSRLALWGGRRHGFTP